MFDNQTDIRKGFKSKVFLIMILHNLGSLELYATNNIMVLGRYSLSVKFSKFSIMFAFSPLSLFSPKTLKAWTWNRIINFLGSRSGTEKWVSSWKKETINSRSLYDNNTHYGLKVIMVRRLSVTIFNLWCLVILLYLP